MLNHRFLQFRNHKLVTLQIVLLIGVSILLRLAGLGYSNFQGDEILALCRYSDYETPSQFIAYLLGQKRKGPIQFLITCAYSLFNPTFSREFAVRFFTLRDRQSRGSGMFISPRPPAVHT